MDRIRPTYGVLFSHCRGQYQLSWVSGIEQVATEHDVNIVYISGRCIHHPFPADGLQNVVYDTILPESLDGMLISSMLMNYATCLQRDAFVQRFTGIPLITANFQSRGLPAVYADNTCGFKALLRHLLVEHGYRKVAFVGGPALNPDAVERYTVFREMLAANGIACDPRLIVEGHFTYESGRTAVSVLLDESGLSVGDIEAIVVANDMMAFGIIDNLLMRGIRVPGDIAVTGFDNIEDARTNILPLTTVQIPIFEIGKEALRRLVDPGSDREHFCLDTQFIKRESCGCRGTQPDDTGRGKAVSEYFIHKLIYTNDEFHECRSIPELGARLKSSLPELGIDEGYLFLYTDPAKPAQQLKLAAAFHNGMTQPEKINQLFDFGSIVRMLTAKDKRRSYCMLPLVSRGAQLGCLFLELNTRAWIAYESIQNQIANSLKNIFLLQDMGKVNRKLRLADAQKTRFFINIAHETKTPLTLIKNYLEKYLRRHQLDPDLHIVKQNIDILLLNMIEFLDAEKLERGRIDYNHAQLCNLSALIRDKVVLFRELAKQRGMQINTAIAADVSVRADPWAMDRILNNLLDNAVKYGNAQGRIDVVLECRAAAVLLTVEDNGPGIDPAKIKHIFKPYYQLSHAKSARQGIGMGLYIVKKTLDTMGGSIRVESTEGAGSRFIITLERCAGIAEAFNVSTISDTLPVAAVVAEEKISPKFMLRMNKEERQSRSIDKSSLLVVDDNASMRAFLQSALNDRYNVFAAAGAREALELLENIPEPEIIISDIMMDDMDGHALLAALAADARFRSIPFIFLTAKNTEHDKITGYAQGAVDYIEKPFSSDALSFKIAALIAFRKRLHKAEAVKIRNSIVDMLSGEKEEATEHLSAAAGSNNYFDTEKICMQYKLSVRERAVVQLMLQGVVNKEISARLHVKLRTVEFHIINLYKKLGVKDRYALYNLFRSK